MGRKRAGKNSKKCKRYRDEGRRERNKRRKAQAHELHLMKCAERRKRKEELNESKTQ